MKTRYFVRSGWTGSVSDSWTPLLTVLFCMSPRGCSHIRQCALWIWWRDMIHSSCQPSWLKGSFLNKVAHANMLTDLGSEKMVKKSYLVVPNPAWEGGRCCWILISLLSGQGNWECHFTSLNTNFCIDNMLEENTEYANMPIRWHCSQEKDKLVILGAPHGSTFEWEVAWPVIEHRKCADYRFYKWDLYT